MKFWKIEIQSWFCFNIFECNTDTIQANLAVCFKILGEEISDETHILLCAAAQLGWNGLVRQPQYGHIQPS